LFANLQESEKKYYDTRPFCGAYKENGQPMNTSIQMDADEFFNIFFDRLENVLKGTPQVSVTHIPKTTFSNANGWHSPNRKPS